MKRIAGILIALILLCAAGVASWIAYTLQVDRSHPVAEVRVVIPRGASFHEIAGRLQAAGVIDNAATFRLYAKLRHADREAHAGAFAFTPHMTAIEVLNQLQSGGAQIAKWLTIPEGYTAAQIAQRLDAEGIGSAGRFESAFMHDSIVLGGVRTTNMEGYLFPSTYLIPVDASPQTVESIMSGQFRKELPRDASRKARAHGLTVPQVVTLASLVEREAKSDDERALMAGVYYNRLRIGMPLEVDATIEYAFPQHHTVITYADLKTQSPYNTYLHPGLPPTPIANPGEPSLVAAFNPKPSPYLYYVYKGNGHHAFATTLAQQNANIAKYLK